MAKRKITWLEELPKRRKAGKKKKGVATRLTQGLEKEGTDSGFPIKTEEGSAIKERQVNQWRRSHRNRNQDN